MQKKPAIIEFLSFLILSGIVLSCFSLIEHMNFFIDFFKEKGIHLCEYTNGCDYTIGLIFALIIFILQVYLGYLFKKEKKQFPLYFISILIMNLLIEGSFFLIESINVSSFRLIFGIFYLIIFLFYFFGTEESKKVFCN